MSKKLLGLFFAMCLPLGLTAVVIAANTNSGEIEEQQVSGTPIIDSTPPTSDESQEKLRAVGRSMSDYSPLYFIFCPVEGTIAVYNANGELYFIIEQQDEDDFWTLVEINAKVTGHSMAGNMDFFRTWNATHFDNDAMTVTIYDDGIRTIISFDKNMFVLPDMPDDESQFFRHEVLQSAYADLNGFVTMTEYDDYGNSVIYVLVEETFFENFINESLHSLSNQELNKLYAPFRAIAETISDTYGLNWTFHDSCEYLGRHWIIWNLESSLLSLSLEEYEQNLQELVPFLLLEKLVSYLNVLIDMEYETGLINRVQMIELRNMVFRSDRAYDQVMNLKETILQKLQPTNPHSAEVLENIENIIYRLRNFRLHHG